MDDESTPDPARFGYDPQQVAQVLCMRCETPIGQDSYREQRTLARYGQMLFWHARCWDKAINDDHAGLAASEER